MLAIKKSIYFWPVSTKIIVGCGIIASISTLTAAFFVDVNTASALYGSSCGSLMVAIFISIQTHKKHSDFLKKNIEEEFRDAIQFHNFERVMHLLKSGPIHSSSHIWSQFASEILDHSEKDFEKICLNENYPKVSLDYIFRIAIKRDNEKLAAKVIRRVKLSSQEDYERWIYSFAHTINHTQLGNRRFKFASLILEIQDFQFHSKYEYAAGCAEICLKTILEAKQYDLALKMFRLKKPEKADSLLDGYERQVKYFIDKKEIPWESFIKVFHENGYPRLAKLP